jgi:adenylate kinase family enzyme
MNRQIPHRKRPVILLGFPKTLAGKEYREKVIKEMLRKTMNARNQLKSSDFMNRQIPHRKRPVILLGFSQDPCC